MYQVGVSPSPTASDRGLDVKLSVVNLNIVKLLGLGLLIEIAIARPRELTV